MSLNFPASPTVGQQSVQNGRTYSWTGTVWEFVTANANDGNEGSVSDTLLRGLLVPQPPTGVTVTTGNSQATVSWTAPALVVPPILDYIVQYSSDSGVTWTTFNDGTSTQTSVTITPLTGGVSYIFRVAAANGVGAGEYSPNTTSFVIPVPITTNPAYGPVTGDGTFASPWSWQSGSGFSGGNSAKLLTAGLTTFIKGDVTSTGGGNCDFGEERSLGIYSAADVRLRSMPVNTTATLAPGEYVMLELDCAHARANIYVVDGTPVAPTGFSMVAGNAQAALSWTAPADNGATSITNYSVEYTPTGGSPTTTLLNSTLTSSRVLSGLTNGTTYSVRIAAVNSVGVGAYNSAVSVTPQDGPPVTLHIPYGPVTGSGTVASKWSWQSGSGFSMGTGAKLLTAEGAVTLQATLSQTGGGNCDGGEGLSLGIYSSSNVRVRTMSGNPESLTAGQYIFMELDCAHGRAEVWAV